MVQAVMGRFTVPANTYVEGWGKPQKKSLRKLSLSWDLNLKYLTYKAGGLIQHLFTDAFT